MPYDFPTNPASGTVVMVPDGSYRVWDSTKWRASPSSNSMAGGPFLPLTGGTVSGPTTINATLTALNYYTPGNTITLSGSVNPLRLGSFSANWAGASTITGNTTLAAVAIGNSSDTASIAAGGARSELQIGGNYGGPTYSGSRVGVFTQMNWNAASPNANTNDVVGCFGGVAVASVNAGGVATGFGVSQFGKGQLFGANPWARLASGATFFNSVVGEEIDFSLATGSSSAVLGGLQVILTLDHQVKAAAGSFGIGLAAQVGAAANLDAGYVLGGISSQWPIDANSGYVFRTSYSQNSVDPHCAGGIDLLHLIPDGTGGKYGYGFSYRGPGTVAASAMDTTGAWRIGTGYISGGAGGLSIDSSLWVLTGTPTVAAGGSGYTSNDKVTDGRGSLFSCTVAGGVVTAVTVLKRAEGQGTNLTGTIATNAVHRAGSSLGSGLTLNETWTQANALSLQPNGGPTTAGGGLLVAGAAWLGNASGNNYWQISGQGGGGSPTIQVAGSGDAFAVISGLGQYGPLLGTGHGYVLLTRDSGGTVGNYFTMQAAAAGGVAVLTCSDKTGGLTLADTGNKLGFNGSVAIAKPTVSGAKGSNAALASLMTALAAYGLVTDSTSA